MQLFVNDLTVIDFSYLCPRRGVIGESWIVDLTLVGSLDEQSMVLDFAKVKKQVKKIIDEVIDHKLAVPTKASVTTITAGEKGTLVDFNSENGGLVSIFSPDEAFAMIEASQVDIGSAGVFLTDKIHAQLPDNVEQVILNLRPENINGFYYHYTHGLKKHDGNCQRITHGHRSKVIVQENGMKSPKLQKYWSDRWQDIYLASSEDQLEFSQLLHITPPSNKDDYYAFGYEAAQGYFELMIGVKCTEIIPCDTTVECLAEFMNGQLKQLRPEADYQVSAFEGVAKGAIV
ncbi:MAG: 6-pyruvoyl-tetrahydropterin synthase [Alteromonadaceae bacterium]|jgi:6-pyruvoyl-tetrahydropterin synthase